MVSRMDDYLLAQHSRLESKHWWFIGRRAIVGEVLAQRLEPGTNRRILDLGCGAGSMVPLLARFGTVEALDTSDEAVAWCRERFPDATFEVGRIPDALPPAESLDVVCAFDVIEHLADDVASIAGIREALVPGGTFVCTVPAYQWMWGPHDELNHHYRRYTRPRLVSTLEAGGLEVDWASYYNAALLPAVAVVRVGRRLLTRDRPPASDLDLRVGPLNGLLARLLSGERHLLRRFRLPFGVSIAAVAHRPAQ